MNRRRTRAVSPRARWPVRMVGSYPPRRQKRRLPRRPERHRQRNKPSDPRRFLFFHLRIAVACDFYSTQPFRSKPQSDTIMRFGLVGVSYWYCNFPTTKLYIKHVRFRAKLDETSLLLAENYVIGPDSRLNLVPKPVSTRLLHLRPLW